VFCLFQILISLLSLVPAPGPPGYFDLVDIFNVRSGAWTTAALSVGRMLLAATSLPNDGVAIFAGGCKLWCLLNVPQVFTRCTGVGIIQSNVVDIFDVRSGAWTTAALSVARSGLAATSLPNDGVAIFAGGQSVSCDYSLSMDAFCL
jgi:hypothetical protein